MARKIAGAGGIGMAAGKGGKPRKTLTAMLAGVAGSVASGAELRGTVTLPPHAPVWKKLLIVMGPGLLVAVGYIDPGNWATDIAAGAKYGYDLLFVVLLASLAAIFLQCLSMRVGVVTGKDLAQLSRARYGRKSNFFQWVMAELSIVACDIAEVLGGALAFHLLFGCSMATGILITGLDTFIILGLRGRGFRQVEAVILGLVMTVSICYVVELWLVGPDWAAAGIGLAPVLSRLKETDALYLAIGIVGATVMPHNLYLHSSVVQTRQFNASRETRAEMIRLNTADTVISLLLAFFVNAAILVLAAAAFHTSGHTDVADIEQAYRLLEPVMGTALAGFVFALALLAAGQSSTFTGTIAGQVVLEGYMGVKLPFWQRRLITRALALLPALIGVLVWGDGAIGNMMVLSQVVLGLQLPFAMYPLIRFVSDRGLMHGFAIRRVGQSAAWALFAVIVGCNIWLMFKMV
ncbi:MAG: Mn(2+) uptake NRAMP transporter MntH [Alphaproteobacteria bacterium]|nr:Mn(2+) uptake NRAMP transporter MntH [Alphaproteobacteria bacterium]